jgi:hypothetical protein
MMIWSAKQGRLYSVVDRGGPSSYFLFSTRIAGNRVDEIFGKLRQKNRESECLQSSAFTSNSCRHDLRLRLFHFFRALSFSFVTLYHPK